MENNKNSKYTCPCYGYKTLDEEPPGTYDICSICFWEDDPIQYEDTDCNGGANHVSLRNAQENFKAFGACEKRCLEYVRNPNEDDIYIGPKDVSNIRRMPIEELIKIFKAVNAPMEKILDLYNGTKEIKMSKINRIEEILQFEYENKMISEGKNFPNININENNLKDVCILLHNKISIDEISKYFGWSQEELSKRLEALLKEELIEKKHGEYVPNFMVISLDEGKELSKELNEIADEVIKLIEANFEKIKSETYKLECFKQFTFNELSLFILSNVLLDCIQIDNVESIFLNSERTRRNGMNYYFSLQEKYKDDKKEALGIYGNMFRYYGDAAFGFYGNERNGINFHTINRLYLENYFGSFDLERENHIKQYLLEELLKNFHQNDYQLKRTLVNGFNELGIMKENKINVPVLNKDEFYRLKDIADIIKNDYINIFEENRERIHSKYNNSSYSNEISFEEYFIWWYHLLYSRVTEMLIESSMIEMPNKSNFGYIVY